MRAYIERPLLTLEVIAVFTVPMWTIPLENKLGIRYLILALGSTASYTLSKIYDVTEGFLTHTHTYTPNLSKCLALFAVVEEWLLLHIG